MVAVNPVSTSDRYPFYTISNYNPRTPPLVSKENIFAGPRRLDLATCKKMYHLFIGTVYDGIIGRCTL